jgi:hypothetical protein
MTNKQEEQMLQTTIRVSETMKKNINLAIIYDKNLKNMQNIITQALEEFMENHGYDKQEWYENK